MYGSSWGKKTFWTNGEPDVHVKHNIPYLIETKAVPNYDQRVKIDESYMTALGKSVDSPDFWPMGKGRVAAVMGGTGGRPEIGLMLDSHAAYVLTMDKRVLKAVLGTADLGGSFGSHRRDRSDGPASGEPLDILHWPYSSLLATTGDTKNPRTGLMEKFPMGAGSSTMKPDEAHQPAFAYLAWLLRGDKFYADELQFWANFSLYLPNCHYRQFEKGNMVGGQIRGQAWTIRNVAECAAYLPDNHITKAAFHYFLKNTALQYLASHVNPAGKYYCPFGASLDGAIYGQNAYLENKYTADATGKKLWAVIPNVGVAPWQDDHLMSALGHAYELTEMPELLEVMKWKGQFSVGRIIAAGFCHVDGAVYSLRIQKTPPMYDAKGLLLSHTRAQTLAEAYDMTFHADRKVHPCGSVERLAYLNSIRGLPSNPLKLNEIIGFSYSNSGYPSNMQPALAYAVDAGVEGGARAWRIFDARDTQPDYNFGPQFAIVPRTVGSGVPIDVPLVVPPKWTPPVAPVPSLPPVVELTREELLAKIAGLEADLVEVQRIVDVMRRRLKG
jgi:hypothetical protein